jgi:2-polyprenyl-6-hydroxyphenyl methylase/3-demethylubiquinone-9 3-methyltransferase
MTPTGPTPDWIPVGAPGASPDAERVRLGELPARYAEPWRGQFLDRARPALRPGMTILDVGSGRRPALPPEWRPPGTSYVGLDISGEELAAAQAGDYDEAIVGDIGVRIPRLVGTADLILSWQVLEHVADLGASLENMKRYLRPGGRMVAMLSGAYSAFALIARVMPYPIRVLAMERLLHMDPDAKFRTRYDRCTSRALNQLLDGWASHDVLALYRGAVYFTFSRILEGVYLRYEDALVRQDRATLATHYLVVGEI